MQHVTRFAGAILALSLVAVGTLAPATSAQEGSPGPVIGWTQLRGWLLEVLGEAAPLPEPTSDAPDPAASGPSIEHLVGQKLMVTMAGHTPSTATPRPHQAR